MTSADDASSRWRNIQRVIDGALDIAPAARAAYINDACKSDADLRDTVARLVEACDLAGRTGGVLDGPASAFAAPMFADLAARDATSAVDGQRELTNSVRAALSERYSVERELGRGGMATVFLARDIRHDRTVAVKVLQRDVIAPQGAERFLHEIRIAARLTHPHVLPVHDSGEANGLLYYVMPFIDGETLRARLIREGRLPLPDAVRLLRELADALAYAHAHGVVHRDLKPENVLLSGGHAIVADFGIAKALHAATHGDGAASRGLTSAGVALGTPAYMAPEQAVGDTRTDHRADLYALGVLGYELLAGAHPFGVRSPQALLMAHLTEVPSPLGDRRADTPRVLAALIMRLLEKLPEDRPASAESVLRTLDEVQATIESPMSASRTVSRKFRVRLTAVVVAGIGLAALAGLALWRRARLDGSVNPARVAVARFENRTRLDSLDALGAILADVVSNGLARTGVVDVVPTASVMDAAASMGRNHLSFDAKSLGRQTNAGIIVYGSYFLRGDSLAIQSQVIDGNHDRVLFPIDLVVVPLSDPMDGIRAVLERVMVTLSSRVNPLLGKAASLAELPKSMEAYRAYIAGFENFFAGDADDDVRARTQFYRAATLDSTFVSALTWAAITEWGFNSNVPRVDSLLKIVEQRRGQLLPFDLASLDYLRAWVDGDIEGAQAAARQRAAVGGGGWNSFAVQGALRLNRIDEAYDYVRESIKAPLSLSSPTIWASFGEVLHARGEHARELREVQNGIARVGNKGDLFDAELRALAALGRLGEIRARIETAKSGSMSGALGRAYQATTSELRAHGFLAHADTLARDAVQWDRRSVADSPTWRSRFDLAASLFDIGGAEAAEADTIFSALVSEGLPGPYRTEHFRGLDAAALGYLGVSAAARGDMTTAERVITRLESFQRPYLLGANLHWQARIAAQRGQCDRAVQYLRAALKSGSSYQQSPQRFLSETSQFAALSCDAYKDFMKPKK